MSADPSAWSAEDFSVRADISSDHFNFTTGLVVDPGAVGVARLAIHYRSPDDCLLAELAGGQLSLVTMRGGLPRTLSSAVLEVPLGPGEHAFELRRRGAMVAAALDGRVMAVSFAGGFSGGKAAVGSQGAGVRFVGPKVVGLDPVLFTDDFMRSKLAEGQWRKVLGKWENQGPVMIPGSRKEDPWPSMSANAFRYSGQGQPAMAVTGQSFWDLYCFAASLHGAPGGQMGLVFGYRDERNYGIFRWSARQEPLRSAAGSAELLAVVDGREVLLQRALIGYIPDQWYRAEVTLGWGWAEVAVDGRTLLSVADPRLAGGAVGLWASSVAETLFDDVLVVEAESFQERFSGPAGTWSSWDFLDAEPRLADGRQAEGLELEDRSGAEGRGGLAIFGSPRWVNCAVRAELLPGEARCGLLYHYRDAANYSCLSYDPAAGRIEILAVQDGRQSTLCGLDARLSQSMHVFEVRLDRGLVRAAVDGRHELFAWQSGHGESGLGAVPGGRAGLAVWAGGVLVRSVTVRMLAESEPLPVVNPVFATDAEMGTWSSWQGDWVGEIAGSGPEAVTVRRHRARFSGDVQFLAEVTEMVRAGRPCELILCVAGNEDKPEGGYSLRLVRPAAAGGGPVPGQAPAALILSREGRKVADAAAPDEPITTIALRRAGPFLIGMVNSRQLIVWRDPEPLAGQRAAWWSKGVGVGEDGLRVYCPAVRSETFERAPAEWRVAEGLWEVTNRYQCDARWSFFSGRPASRQKKLAAVWNKREFGDDAVLEFFAGIQMDQARGGQYQYARDINCVLSADGRDLASGYSFLFGGFDDNRSSILRKGVEVVKTSPGGNSVIPRTGGIHHRWYYVRAERRGAQLRFTVDDGRLVDLTFTDPDPLPGRRMAVWTWDCGIMISRVRASGPESGGIEPLDFAPGSGFLAPVKDKAYEYAE